MIENIFTVKNKDDLAAAAEWLFQKAETRKKWLIYGNMGAGKTTLVTQLVKYLGFKEAVVSSPTFPIVNEYINPNGEASIFHIDLYRLRNTAEALDIDVESYLDSPNYCFIEWPHIIETLADAHFFKILIELGENNTRKILIL